MRSRQSTIRHAPLGGVITLMVAHLVCSPGCTTLRVEDPAAAPLYGPRSGEVVPNEYIVVLKDDVDDTARLRIKQEVSGLHGAIGHEYHSVLNGFSVSIDPEGLKTLPAKP